LDLQDKIEQSREIYQKALADYKPYAICVMLSGGDDSLTVLALANYLDIPIDYIIHGNTGTGLPEATEFVRDLAKKQKGEYLEGNAKSDYEKYVTRKGFFGQGKRAHSYAYHILKANQFRSLISSNIRKRKRGRNVLLLNGVRIDESENRADNYANTIYRNDPAAKSNIWTNLIHYWTKKNCLEFLEAEGVERSPVSICLGRSGECMCGTMQSMADRTAAAKFNPDWGKWLDKLERHVVLDKKFPWRWGSTIPKTWNLEKHGQTSLFQNCDLSFMPACTGCKRRNKESSIFINSLNS